MTLTIDVTLRIAGKVIIWSGVLLRREVDYAHDGANITTGQFACKVHALDEGRRFPVARFFLEQRKVFEREGERLADFQRLVVQAWLLLHPTFFFASLEQLRSVATELISL